MQRKTKKTLNTIGIIVAAITIVGLIGINGGMEIINGNRFAAAQEEKVSFEFEYPNNYYVSLTKNVGTLTDDEKNCLLSFWNSKAEDTNTPVFPTEHQELILTVEEYSFLMAYKAETRTFCIPDSAYFPGGPRTSKHLFWLNEAEKKCALAVGSTEDDGIQIRDNRLYLTNTQLRTLLSMRQFYKHMDEQVPESNICEGL